MSDTDGCTAVCWTAVSCPDHGVDMTPRGRSVPLAMHQCCDNYANPAINPRHLWSEHDDCRWFVDPRGWERHSVKCERCSR